MMLRYDSDQRNVIQVRNDSFQHFEADVSVEVQEMKLKRVRRSEALDLTMHEITEGADRAFCPLRK